MIEDESRWRERGRGPTGGLQRRRAELARAENRPLGGDGGRAEPSDAGSVAPAMEGHGGVR
jgi:hypothetical protein